MGHEHAAAAVPFETELVHGFPVGFISHCEDSTRLQTQRTQDKGGGSVKEVQRLKEGGVSVPIFDRFGKLEVFLP